MKKFNKYIFMWLVLGTSLVAIGQDVNYDEGKIEAYQLPELLLSGKGKKITSKKLWEKTRVPEILSLFEEHVYGKVPVQFDSIKFITTHEEKEAMDGAAHLKQVEIMVYRNKESVSINLVLFIPTNIKKAAPVFLLINNRSARNTSPTRDTISGFWPAEKVIKAGYAIAAFQVNDAAPDHRDRYKDGMLRLYPELLAADNGIKAVGAWAWAASRVMDYFEKDAAIDAKKVAVVGHSRGGKASLWTAAQDQRFALCISNNSGNTGAALSRRNFGETVAIINSSFPHWFNNNYKKYNNNEAALPVDQHMLIALIAPRPVYAASASTDLWADPKGTLLAMKHAEEVYRLYGIDSNLPETSPPFDTPVNNPYLGYHIRKGDHNLTPYDWQQYIKFADIHWR